MSDESKEPEESRPSPEQYAEAFSAAQAQKTPEDRALVDALVENLNRNAKRKAEEAAAKAEQEEAERYANEPSSSERFHRRASRVFGRRSVEDDSTTNEGRE